MTSGASNILSAMLIYQLPNLQIEIAYAGITGIDRSRADLLRLLLQLRNLVAITSRI